MTRAPLLLLVISLLLPAAAARADGARGDLLRALMQARDATSSQREVLLDALDLRVLAGSLRRQELPQPVRAIACAALARTRSGRACLVELTLGLALDAPPEAVLAVGRAGALAVVEDGERAACSAALLELLAASRARPERPLLPPIAAALGELADAAAVSGLAETLLSAGADSRAVAAALVVAGQRQPRTAQALLAALARFEPAPGDRPWAHVVLGELGDPVATEYLAAVVARGLDPGAEPGAAERTAAVALARLSHREALEALLDAEADAPDPLRRWILEALALARGDERPALVATLRQRLRRALERADEAPAVGAYADTLRALTDSPGATMAELVSPTGATTETPTATATDADEPSSRFVLLLAVVTLVGAATVRARIRRAGRAGALVLVLVLPLPRAGADEVASLLEVDERPLAPDELEQRVAALGPAGLARLGDALRAAPRRDVILALARAPGGEPVLLGLLDAPSCREAALEPLARHGTDQALPRLLELVASSGSSVRQQAVRACLDVLRRSEERPRWVEALTREVERAEQPERRAEAQAALRVVVALDEWRGAPALRVALQGPLRRDALSALGRLARPSLDDAESSELRDQLQPLVLDVLRARTSPPTDRGLALQALSRWGAADCLSDALDALDDPALRESATRALERLTGGRVADPEAWRALLSSHSQQLDALREVLDTPATSPEGRAHAIKALGRLRMPGVFELLARFLRARPPEGDAIASCSAFVLLRDGRAVSLLAEVAADPAASEPLKARAAWARAVLSGVVGATAQGAAFAEPALAVDDALAFVAERAARAASPAPASPAPASPALTPPARLDPRPGMALSAVVVVLVALRAWRQAEERDAERRGRFVAMQAAQRDRHLVEPAALMLERPVTPPSPRGTERFDGGVSWRGSGGVASEDAEFVGWFEQGIASLRAAEEAGGADRREQLRARIAGLEAQLGRLRGELAAFGAGDGGVADEPTVDVAALRRASDEEPTTDVAALRAATDEEPTTDVAALRAATDEEPTIDVAALRAATDEEPTVDVVALRRASSDDEGAVLQLMAAAFLAGDDTYGLEPALPLAAPDDLSTTRVFEPLIPTTEFRLIRSLGRGSQATVWEAVGPDGPVALKLLPRRSDEESHRRLAREADLCARIDSPHVVKVGGVREARDGRAYLIMELVQGPSLIDAVRQGPMRIIDVLRVGVHVARALVALARVSVVHRDVKPHNILVGIGETPTKLTDFGIGMVEGEVSELTCTGSGLGTLPYVAPEQVLDASAATSRTDVYSLGATMYHAMTGRPVLVEEQFDALVMSVGEYVPHLIRSRPAIRSLRGDCPEAFAALIDEMLTIDPAARPDVEAVLARFEQLEREASAATT